MITHTQPDHRRPVGIWAPAGVAGLLALFAFSQFHITGIRITPDGWAYWQGAVSMVSGHGYRYFLGDPIVMWPPLYSLYLAPWMWLGGPTTISLAMANGAMVVVQTVLWTVCLLELWQRHVGEPGRLARYAVAIYLGLLVPLYHPFALSETLKYALLAPFFWVIWNAGDESRGTPTYRWAAAGAIVGALLMATHHASLAFIVAGAGVGGWRSYRPGQQVAALASAGIVLAVPLACALLLRAALDQWSSHTVGLSAAGDTPINYFRGAVQHVVEMFSGGLLSQPRLAVIPALALLGAATRRWLPLPILVGGAFVSIAAAVTLMLFSTVQVADALDTRFLLFIPLVIGPFLLLAAGRWPLAMAVPAFALLLVPLAHAAIVYADEARHPWLSDTAEFLDYNTRISPDYPKGPPIETGRDRLVAPGP